MNRVVIFANGSLPDLEKARLLLRPDDFLVAADGGTHHALALGLTPNLVVGDLDSLPEGEKAESIGAPFVEYPRDKDATDLELAFRHALELQPRAILVLAALGGRFDQSLGNLSLLSDPRLAALDVRADDGVEEILFARQRVEVRGRSGDLLSLLPWGGAVEGVRTTGLRWPLRGETLYPEKTRGISNEMSSEMATISLQSGLLLVVHHRLS